MHCMLCLLTSPFLSARGQPDADVTYTLVLWLQLLYWRGWWWLLWWRASPSDEMPAGLKFCTQCLSLMGEPAAIQTANMRTYIHTRFFRFVTSLFWMNFPLFYLFIDLCIFSFTHFIFLSSLFLFIIVFFLYIYISLLFAVQLDFFTFFAVLIHNCVLLLNTSFFFFPF